MTERLISLVKIGIDRDPCNSYMYSQVTHTCIQYNCIQYFICTHFLKVLYVGICAFLETDKSRLGGPRQWRSRLKCLPCMSKLGVRITAATDISR